MSAGHQGPESLHIQDTRCFLMKLSFDNIDRFCAEVDLAARDSVIDLSRLEFIEPFAIIYLGQFIRYHNRLGTRFTVRMPPVRSKSREYLARVRFWDRFNFDADTIEREGMFGFLSATSLNDIVELPKGRYVAEETAELVAGVLGRSGVKVSADAVLEVVAELSDNFAQHAEVELATLAVQYYPNLHEFAIAVGDSGLGIRESLSRNPEHAYLQGRPHHEAIEKAFEPLVSRRPEGGTGLTNVRDIVIRQAGRLRVASNDGFVYIGEGRTKRGKRAYELPGVQIDVTFPERT